MADSAVVGLLAGKLRIQPGDTFLAQVPKKGQTGTVHARSRESLVAEGLYNKPFPLYVQSGRSCACDSPRMILKEAYRRLYPSTDIVHPPQPSEISTPVLSGQYRRYPCTSGYLSAMENRRTPALAIRLAY